MTVNKSLTPKLRSIIAAATAMVMGWFKHADAVDQGEVLISLGVPDKPCRYKPQSLAELLAELPHVFKMLSSKTLYAMNRKDTRAALIKLGPHVPWNRLMSKITWMEKVQDPKKLSTLMFVALGDEESKHGTEDMVHGQFSYAVLAPKRTPNVSKPIHNSKYIYECGTAHDLEVGQLVWWMYYVSVDAGGNIEILQNRQSRVVCCPKAKEKPNRKGVMRGRSYTQHYYAMPELQREDLPDETSIDRYLKTIFGITANFWATKEYQWSVSCRKNKKRVTFCVPVKETKTYFKNRDINALTATGKRKTIIHHVIAHERILPSGKVTKVKEHIRGQRKFYWLGYECAVTAPKFHKFTTGSFNISPEHYEEGESTEGTYSMPEVADILTKLEDDQHRKVA
jgi:hypothetical protein